MAKKLTKREKIISALRRRRNATYADIARWTDSSESYVRQVARDERIWWSDTAFVDPDGTPSLCRIQPDDDPPTSAMYTADDIDHSLVLRNNHELLEYIQEILDIPRCPSWDRIRYIGRKIEEYTGMHAAVSGDQASDSST